MADKKTYSGDDLKLFIQGMQQVIDPKSFGHGLTKGATTAYERALPA